ncbi:MAG TPA: hypothetical protein VIY73_00220, partial [Polyangiaceae bacterium]
PPSGTYPELVRAHDASPMPTLLVRRLLPVAVVACLVPAANGCASHECADVGMVCGQTEITLVAKDDAWAPGAYTVNFSGPAAASTCNLTVPSPVPSNGVSGTCALSDGAVLTLAPVMSCPAPTCNDEACGGASCSPVPGHFQLSLSLQAMASSIDVQVLLGASSIASVSVTPVAATTEPNGPGCGDCTNASATVSVD